MRLVDRGRGPPVLLLHGNPDSADLWAGVIARLSPHFRCLAPDLPAAALLGARVARIEHSVVVVHDAQRDAPWRRPGSARMSERYSRTR